MQKQNNNRIFTPELLAPAGSYEALCAAIEAGADAVYMGGEFNARAGARNFDRDAIREAIALCHAYGVKAYITLNTLVYERELEGWLEYARYLWECGADAFILADLGAAMALSRYIPGVRMHASTQMSVHNTEGVRSLSRLGFERVVVARELSRENIRSINSGVDCEIEMFVHGALCVSASGQCLFSSLVGGRSGNRGECAQPCRLDYDGRAVLSLRDNCLAGHISEIIDMGVSSLKIEGRMKNPEYVYGTVSIYRRLLDERRDATDEEIREMSALFSRSGFTDGYYVSETDSMCGVRTDRDKEQSRALARFEGLKRKVPLDIEITVREGERAHITVSDGKRSFSSFGETARRAENAPIDEQTVSRALTKLGATPYEAREVRITLDGSVFMRASELNALRREAIEGLMRLSERVLPASDARSFIARGGTRHGDYGSSARFISAEQLAESGVSTADFDRIFLPLCEYFCGCGANGVVIPALVYDDEWEDMRARLSLAREQGAVWAVCANISQISLARELGFMVTADFRLNVLNPNTAEQLMRLGAHEIILSPELRTAGMRDIRSQKSVIVYGRIPLMITEKCVVREASSCKACRDGRAYYLSDRTGARFPVFREREHRSVIYNSAYTYMADKSEALAALGSYAPHFIFSDEKPSMIREVVSAYRTGRSASSVFGRDARFRRL